MHPMIESILNRRSIRKYSDLPVEEELLRQILLAGLHAPSAHDSRPWRIAAVVTPAAKQTLIEALTENFCGDMRRAGIPSAQIEQRASRSRAIFSGASALLVLFAKVQSPDNPLANSVEIERLMTAQSVALAAGQILLAASHAGLGGCWFAAPLFCPDQVCKACSLDIATWSPHCLITLGYPAEEPKTKALPRLEDSVFYL